VAARHDLAHDSGGKRCGLSHVRQSSKPTNWRSRPMKRPRRAKPEITPSTTRSLRQTAASLSDATTNLSEDSGQKDREGRPGIVFCSGPCSSMASRKPDTRSAVTLRASTPPTKTMPRAPDAISSSCPKSSDDGHCEREPQWGSIREVAAGALLRRRSCIL
jgi:hypothetical protein